jgi:hypothetical protein
MLKQSFVIGLERRTKELLILPVAKKQKSRSAHRVRFDLLPQVDTRRVELLTHEEKKLIWWDFDIKKQARLDALAFKDNGEGSLSYISKFHEAFLLCSSIGRLENVPLISDIPVRGLEQCLFPDLIHARLQVVSKVLRAQIKLPANTSLEQQALLLSAVSKN